MKKAVVILSGGLDSTVCMSIAKSKGYDVFPLTFAYGQRHNKEVEQARKVADYYGCNKHLVVDIDFFRAIGESALTSDRINVPVNRSQEELAEGIPVTYVPFRNAVFLSMATGYAESIRAEIIYIGVNALDYSGYPDCRPQFIQAFQEVIRLGATTSDKGAQIKIESPLIHMSKGEIVKLGLKNKSPLHLTTSCYQGRERACGICDSCQLRLKGFSDAGTKDPIQYEEVM
ncbi:queuosine Biosynthesis QueC ATPase [Desulfocucumis palustris]|uniref:7-cyano-7-deazaguanine synthase n=1 Tax=Desulfocucumis palustris TaxID=1898651 RepID=A0A2L2X6Q0_9FIRM|nr:7-cyano-7-deazaguanine synthase QueC [Desulfocucumis palustris]GBF31827.1 queuosine Biosynthesis QueC ATPase [Desulfocucumis palustris]